VEVSKSGHVLTLGEFAGAVGNVADDIKPRVQGAASSTKETISNVLPSGVKNAAGSVGDKANIAGFPPPQDRAINLACVPPHEEVGEDLIKGALYLVSKPGAI
jgi:hypothetical protein